MVVWSEELIINLQSCLVYLPGQHQKKKNTSHDLTCCFICIMYDGLLTPRYAQFYLVESVLHISDRKTDLWHFLSILLCRRSPISIAAAVIYMITQLSEDKKPLKGLDGCSIVFSPVTDIQVLILENLLQIYPWLLVWQKAPSEILTRICILMPQGSSRIPTPRKKTWRISAHLRKLTFSPFLLLHKSELDLSKRSEWSCSSLWLYGARCRPRRA
jgi:hypothetical protein